MSKSVRNPVRRLWSRVRASVQFRRGDYSKNPEEYWDIRHGAQQESLDGVGQIGLGHDANEQDYQEKWLRLSGALDELSVRPPATVLDAGCGIGWLSGKLIDRGHTVTCVDFSREAIDIARRRLGNGVDTRVQPIDQPVDGGPFDAVLCVDVLFHVVDDSLWARTVRNLADMSTHMGYLIVQENLAGDTPGEGTATHVRWRTLADYAQMLPGWNLVFEDRYELPHAGTTKDLMAWRRSQ